MLSLMVDPERSAVRRHLPVTGADVQMRSGHRGLPPPRAAIEPLPMILPYNERAMERALAQGLL